MHKRRISDNRVTHTLAIFALVFVFSGIVGWGAVGLAVVAGREPLRASAAWWRGARFLELGPGIMQRKHNDCGPAALAYGLRLLGGRATYFDIASRVPLGPCGCGLEELAREARSRGWVARIQRDRTVRELRAPAILYLRYGHFVVFEKITPDGRVRVHDPALGRLSYSPRALRRQWTGHVLLLARGPLFSLD